ncbi:MAG: hypothetical protein J6O23_11420 [Prevotella sp.]|nr:hypothetical protein [Prevotella sp.]
MNIRKHIYSMVAMAALLLVGCAPDDHSLGSKDITAADLAQGIAYTVTVDQATNTVQLKSLLDSKYSVQWQHPQGRSQAKELSIRIPFGGDYTVTFGVETRGGVVYGEPFNFTINNTNPDLLTGELWTLISGGVGKSKTWVLDLDENGVSKYFVGPMYFAGTDDNWATNHGAPAPEGADSWSWNADWAGNSWITPAMNFGTMTFDLNNGANVQIDDRANGATYNGTYLLDTENYTISFSDAKMLHLATYDGLVVNWSGDLRLFSLTEHTMQIAALRDPVLSGEGACRLVFNFISKEAYDDPSLLPTEGGSDTFQEQPVTDPTFSGLNDQLAVTTFNALSYKINEDAPYDWVWWNGATGAWVSNDFKAVSEYPSWAPVPEGYDEIALKLEKTSDNGGEYTATQYDGTELAGKYTLSGNTIVFDKEINFLSAATNRVKPLEIKGTTFYVMAIDREEGVLKLGVPDGKNANGQVNQYVVLNLVAQPIGGGQSGPTKLLFDNEKFFYGDIEDNGNFRLELCNQYGFNSGQTYNDPPFNASKLKFSKEMTITFTISGLGTLTAPATAAFGTSIDWSFDGSDVADSHVTHENAQVTGDGTYTVKLKSDGTKFNSANLNVLTVDILGVASKLDGKDADYIAADGVTGKCPNVTVTVTEMTVE